MNHLNYEEAYPEDGADIAVVGMAGRFPRARDLEEFWRNLRDGVECVSFFSPEEVKEAGVDPALAASPQFVNARAILEDAEHFDAGFFGLSPKEAELTDPQHRLFLECAWEALEDAGCNPERQAGLIGVYAGADINAHTLRTLMFSGAGLQALIGSDKDFLATRVCYKLNLRGPGVSVQTACSTSLVAVQMACQGLLNYQCDMALAGGVGVAFPQKAGYLYQEGGILSPDGHCRPFDAAAHGTIGGDGVGGVALKRLADARRDGDFIHAVIRGAAINNDGALKVGFTAPSVQGQAEVISMALAGAGVEPDSIGYVETHGTGTALGDPIEITALTEVFRARTDRTQFCAIGSLKSNVGHMNSAAGIGSLLKTILALKHRQLPPSLNFSAPNPRIDFAASPFTVNTALQDWPQGPTPRRAGVSSFGIGGTNAHVILEEAPGAASDPANRARQVVVVSAKSAAALDRASERLAAHLERHPDLPLADVAHTLQSGRRLFPHCRWMVCRSLDEAQALLRRSGGTTLVRELQAATVAFLFPGQGAQSVNMARELYAEEPLFRRELEHCLTALKDELGFDPREVLYPAPGREAEAAARLEQTAVTQPLLFAVEYALARLWQAWGVQPGAMLGHSLGEYVAACLAGVFSLPDALKLVAARGRLMQRMEPGAMLAVPLTEADLRDRFPGLSIAAINAPAQCVLAGDRDAIAAAERLLSADGVASQRLHTSHAFHSAMMEPMLEEFRAAVGKVALAPPQIPCLSNVSGTWLTAAEAISADYWVRHVRMPVRFADGLSEIIADPNRILLEVGPGRTLATLAARQAARSAQPVLTSLPGPRDGTADAEMLLNALGHLHCLDVAIDWQAVHGGAHRRKVPLPTYPFERQRYWADWGASAIAATAPAAFGKIADPDRWLYRPGWKTAPPAAAAPREQARWLVFMDGEGIGRALLPPGLNAVEVVPGDAYSKLGPGRYVLDPAAADDYARLFQDLEAAPDHVVHLWTLPARDDADALCLGLLFLAQAMAQAMSDRAATLDIVTAGLFDVTGEEPLQPEKAVLLGPARVIPQEYPAIRCRVIDVCLSVAAPLTDLGRDTAPPVVACRGRARWVPVFEPVVVPSASPAAPRLRPGGTYLITGGLGTIGLTLADHLARAGAGNLVLTSRSGLPPAAEWDAWAASHDADDAVSRKIRRVRTVEALGVRVLVLGADAADQDQMREAVRQAERRFGRLDGAIHCAGIVAPRDLLRAIQDTGAPHVAVHFRPKVDGLRVLERVLPPDLDFCVLCSSLSTVLGGVGFAAYAAANHFLDAFAAWKNRSSSFPWISIGWDGWLAEGGARDGYATRFALTPQEGARVFERILRLPPEGRWVVSTTDLAARIALGQALESGDAFPATKGGAAKAGAAKAHGRPALQTEYVAPRTDLERAIAAAWQEVLGFEQIGVDDNFFSLGGDSLAAIQLCSRLRDAFQVDLTVHTLFDEPTVAALSVRIERLLRDSAAASQDLLRQIEMIENMSEEEVARLLAAMEAE